MKKQMRCLALWTFVLGGAVACKKESLLPNEKPQSPNNLSLQNPCEGVTFKNPYTVENMKLALENIGEQSGDPTLKELKENLEPTHLYIKFSPKNGAEMDLLEECNLDLYAYPLDQGVASVEESHWVPVVEGQLVDQYASVPVGVSLPQHVEHEVLAQLFIPDEDTDGRMHTKHKVIRSLESSNRVEDLVNEALKITGHLSETEEPQQRLRSKWRPSGTITVWDDNKGKQIPLQGVYVRARRWFTTHKGKTDVNGRYTCDGRFRREANYSVIWERKDFEIRDGWLSRARMDGPKKRGSWNRNIKGGRQEYYATIFRAAHHYYYKHIGGLRRPPRNSVFKTQVKIRAFYETNNESNGKHGPHRRFLGLGSAIKMFNPHRNSRDIYATTIHELAHASHWAMGKLDYEKADKIVIESWGRGVQRYLTRMVYPSYDLNLNYGYDQEKYTGLVEDLIDGKSGYDQVSGFNMALVEHALDGQRTWTQWKNRLKQVGNDRMVRGLDELFDYWKK